MNLPGKRRTSEAEVERLRRRLATAEEALHRAGRKLADERWRLLGFADNLRFARGVLENARDFSDEGSYAHRAWTYIVHMQERLDEDVTVPEPKPFTVRLCAFYPDKGRRPYEEVLTLRPGLSHGVKITDGIEVHYALHPDGDALTITVVP